MTRKVSDTVKKETLSLTIAALLLFPAIAGASPGVTGLRASPVVAHVRLSWSPPPPSATLVGLNAGGWGVAGQEDVRATGSTVVRIQEGMQGETAEWNRLGVKVILDWEGNYNSGGVQALPASTVVNEIVSAVETNPGIYAVEVLNEPYGTWFWGSNAESSSNETAYASLVRKVNEALVAKFGASRPRVLAAYGNVNDRWGEGVWKHGVAPYADGIVMHSYSWPFKEPLGSRKAVEEAHAKTKLPVYITEVGWNTHEVSEAEQAANIYSFIVWAKHLGYVSAVTVFNWHDFGLTEDWGIETASGVHKASYPAFKAAIEAP
jgi:hypothetical protein